MIWHLVRRRLSAPNLLQAAATSAALKWLVLIFAAGALALLMWQSASLRSQADALRRASQPEIHRTSAPARPPPSADQLEELEAARSILRRLAVPWADLFDTLKSSKPQGLALVSVEPSSDLKRIEIVARTGTYLDAVTFVNRLAATSTFGGVLITRESRRNTNGLPEWEVAIQAKWEAKR